MDGHKAVTSALSSSGTLDDYRNMNGSAALRWSISLMQGARGMLDMMDQANSLPTFPKTLKQWPGMISASEMAVRGKEPGIDFGKPACPPNEPGPA